MYATYTYRAGSTAANILADVILMLTGTTDPLLLSVDCVVASTTITATEAAGWAVYDAAAGVNAQCVRAPIIDDAAQFKYVVVDTNTAGYIHLKLYEAWNAVAHTGTNLSIGTDTNNYSQRLNVGAGGRLDIRATERTILMFSFQGGAYGNSHANAFSSICERTRLSPWDTVVAGYPKVISMISPAISASFPYSSTPRTVSNVGVDVLTSSAIYSSIVTAFNTKCSAISFTTLMTAFTPNSAKVAAPQLLEFGVADDGRGDLGGIISGLCGIYLTTYNYGVVYDTIALGADTYIVWTCGSWRWAIKVA